MTAPSRKHFASEVGRLRGWRWSPIALLPLLTSLVVWTIPGALIASPPLSKADMQRAQTLAAAFLMQRQSADGAWRSQQYGVLKHGPELTPVVCGALQHLGHSTPGQDASVSKAIRYLTELVGPDGRIREGTWGFRYPVYTSAATVEVLSGLEKQAAPRRAHNSFLAFLRGHRFTSGLGWRAGDATFGGWGFSPVPMRRTRSAPVTNDGANLTATLFGLNALIASGVKHDSPEIEEIRRFVFCCQNFAVRSEEADRTFDDGGFFFSPVDTLRNKAGGARDAEGKPRYNSQGSCTADGLRALALCGLKPQHPRVTAATRWLDQHFAVDRQPGSFAKSRETYRAAYYYYYAWSLAGALETWRRWNVAPERQKARAAALAAELLRRQAADGSWRNTASDGKEDDPLIATPLALGALNACVRLIDR